MLRLFAGLVLLAGFSAQASDYAVGADLSFLKQIAQHLGCACDDASLDKLSRVLCGRPLED